MFLLARLEDLGNIYLKGQEATKDTTGKKISLT